MAYPLENNLLLENFRKFSHRKLDSQETVPLYPKAEYVFFILLTSFSSESLSLEPGSPQLQDGQFQGKETVWVPTRLRAPHLGCAV